MTRRRAGTIAAIILVIAGLGAIGVTLGGHHQVPRPDDGVAVVTGPVTVPPPVPMAPASTQAAAVPGASGLPAATTRRVLAALRLQAASTVLEVSTQERRSGAICGVVSPVAREQPRRFVFVDAAGLAALDDGSADFGAFHDQFCR